MKSAPQQDLEFIQTLRQAFEQEWEQLDLPENPVYLYEPVRYAFGGKGKRLRPLLVLLGTYLANGNWQKAMPAAIAVEMLHLFTLVHDDIMDQDTHRHNMPTIHVKWDESVAILTGDLMFTLALSTILKTETSQMTLLLTRLSNGMIQICEGQALDYEFEKRETVSLEEYHLMVQKKTGALLGLSLEAGAIIGDASPQLQRQLFQIGSELGIAFQIQDDLLELISDEKTMGKSLYSDIVSFKKTYPLLLAFSRMNAAERKKYRQIVSSGLAKDKLKQYVIETFEKLEVIQDCKTTIEKNYQNIIQHLDTLPSKRKAPLRLIVEIILNRQR